MKKPTAKTTPEKEAEFYRRRYPEAFVMRDNMKFLADKNGVGLYELAGAAGITNKTMDRRMKEPFLFLDAEVIDICRMLGVSPAQIRVEAVYPMPKPIEFDES